MPTSDVIRLRNVRGSYMSLDKPKKFKSDKNNPDKPGKYQASFILDPSKPADAKQIAEIKKIAKQVFDERWPTGAKLSGKCYTQYGTEDEDGNAIEEAYQNMFVIATSEAEPPDVRGLDGTPISPGVMNDPKRGTYPYSGCYVNAWISLWTQDNDFGKRVNANLRAVQYYAPGDAFSSKPSIDENEFEDLSGQASVDMGSDDFDPLAD